MTSQFDFSNDQWLQVASTPMWSAWRWPGPRTVDSWAASGRVGPGPTGWGSDRKQSGRRSDRAGYSHRRFNRIEQFDRVPDEALADSAANACRELAFIPSSVAEPAEARGSKDWILDVAREGADAAREHGVRVSPGESEVNDRTVEALAGGSTVKPHP